MRTPTLAAVGVVVALLAGAVWVGFGAGGATLGEQWVSDTARDTQFNHHPIGVGPESDTIVAPVTMTGPKDELAADACSLVRLGQTDGAVEWQAPVPPQQCFSHALTQPAVADLDGDGDLEAAVGTTMSALVVYDATSGDEEFRVPMETYGYGQPAVGNLTRDPGVETVAVDIRGNVLVVNESGGVVWRHALGNSTWAPPVLADVDADGATEVVVGTAHNVVALNASGGVEWRRHDEAQSLAVGQADDDPALELFATWTRELVAIDGATGEREWRRTFGENPRVESVVDGDGDGTAEAYVSLSNQHVAALSATNGSTEWETPVTDDPEEPMAPPVVGDVTGDGSLEVVSAAFDGTVAVLSATTGEELASYSREVAVLTHPTLADTDDDGDLEVLVRYADGIVVALDYDEP